VAPWAAARQIARQINLTSATGKDVGAMQERRPWAERAFAAQAKRGTDIRTDDPHFGTFNPWSIIRLFTFSSCALPRSGTSQSDFYKAAPLPAPVTLLWPR
jgi:hypothetical protein